MSLGFQELLDITQSVVVSFMSQNRKRSRADRQRPYSATTLNRHHRRHRCEPQRTSCCYQKDKRVKPGNLETKQCFSVKRRASGSEVTLLPTGWIIWRLLTVSEVEAHQVQCCTVLQGNCHVANEVRIAIVRFILIKLLLLQLFNL